MAQAMRVAVTGATGLIGTRVCQDLRQAGHTAWGLRRGKESPDSTSPSEGGTWDVKSGALHTPAPVDVLIHLAGRNVAARWTAKVKREAWDSRVPATQALCARLARLPAEVRPKAIVMAVGSTIYGDRGDEVLTEDSAVAPQGSSFLSDICLAWEAAAQPARDAGIRLAILRVGAVLARQGGALAKMAGPVKWCLGGPVGPGTQWIPWISLTDLSRLMQRVAEDESVSGVINAVSPEPVRQHAFVRTLGKVLHRPTIFPLPSFMVKLIFGQMGREVLLFSDRVVPRHLPAGFALKHPRLEDAMRAELAL